MCAFCCIFFYFVVLCGGGRSVGTVRSRSKGHRIYLFFFVLYHYKYYWNVKHCEQSIMYCTHFLMLLLRCITTTAMVTTARTEKHPVTSANISRSKSFCNTHTHTPLSNLNSVTDKVQMQNQICCFSVMVCKCNYNIRPRPFPNTRSVHLPKQHKTIPVWIVQFNNINLP